ncbi:MAG: type IV secretory system conjugative DNA transfer family protein, partial [Egibacteraceae bacterium]
LVGLARRGARRARAAGLPAATVTADALLAVRYEAAAAGGGAFIGLDETWGGIIHAPAEAAVLVLGPPRVGKTTSVIIPTVLSAPGAVLSTSTKPDVLLATAPARSRYGTVWAYDPTGGAADLPAGVVRLRWSPLSAAGEWGSARRIAAAMVGASPAAKGTRGESHWTSRAAALLGPLLYAAALDGRDMAAVVGWVLGDADPAAAILEDAAAWNGDAGLARQVLEGVQRAADQERQSIWSATADVIDVYTTSAALAAAAQPNWSPAQFVASSDTVYIAAPAEQQASVGPLVVALIEAVRDAQYCRHRADALAGRRTWPPVTAVLDEVANIAPIASLPALVSEAGGQGLHVVAAVQDLSQVRGRWGPEIADGFLSLFSHVLVLGGIRDTRTLEAISVICGEWLRPTVTTSQSLTHTRGPLHELKLLDLSDRTHSWSQVAAESRERRMPAGDVYALAPGRALLLSGPGWRHVSLTPHWAHPRWQAALAAAPAHTIPRPPAELTAQLPAQRVSPAVRALHPTACVNGHGGGHSANGHGGNGHTADGGHGHGHGGDR